MFLQDENVFAVDDQMIVPQKRQRKHRNSALRSQPTPAVEDAFLEGGDVDNENGLALEDEDGDEPDSPAGSEDAAMPEAAPGSAGPDGSSSSTSLSSSSSSSSSSSAVMILVLMSRLRPGSQPRDLQVTNGRVMSAFHMGFAGLRQQRLGSRSPARTRPTILARQRAQRQELPPLQASRSASAC